MAKQNAGFVHEHVEKLVIGLSGVFLIVAVWYGFASGRFDVNGVSPSELVNSVGEAADRTIGAFQNPKMPTDTDAGHSKDDEAVDKLLAWYGPNSKSIGENVGVPMEVARAEAFPPLFVSTTEVAEEDKHQLARLVEPDMPVVAKGRSTFDFAIERPSLEEYDATARDRTEPRLVNWVAVSAQLDRKQQDLFFKTEKYPPNAYLNIVKVHLQRLDRDEKWRGWQDVDAWLPFEPFDRPPASQAIRLKELIETRQEAIARPRLPERVDGDRIEYDKLMPLLDAPPKQGESLERRAKDWLDRAERAARDRDYESVMVFARSAKSVRNAPSKVIDQAKELYDQALRRLERRPGGYRERPSAPADKLMPIVAYDLSAVPGHQYQYRIRYEALNQYAGEAAELKDPSGANTLTRFSEWSPPTPPVRIESDLQFYLTDANQQRNKVEVTVWKRGRRRWEKQDYRLAVGEAIGEKDRSGADFTTGAVIVDIRFNEPVNGKSDTVLVYVTPDGNLHEAILSVDQQLNEEQKKRA